MTDDLPTVPEQQLANDQLAPQSDPGPEAVDRMLNDMESKSWQPTDVARFARRLRAHIEALRDENDELHAALGEG